MADHAMLHRAVPEMSAAQVTVLLGGRSSHDQYANVLIVDARPRWEYERGHIPGAIHIPAAASAVDRRARLNRAMGQNRQPGQDIDRSVSILVYCGPDDCGLDLLLARALMTDGFDRVYRLRGGLPAWKNAGGAVETVELLQETSD
jgi:rhodanese-related sulfurtransferase